MSKKTQVYTNKFPRLLVIIQYAFRKAFSRNQQVSKLLVVFMSIHYTSLVDFLDNSVVVPFDGMHVSIYSWKLHKV